MTPLQLLKLVGVLSVLSVVFYGGCTAQRNKDNSQISSLNLKIADMKREAAEKQKTLTDEFLKKLVDKQHEIAELDKKHTEIEENAKRKYEAAIADLRADKFRVRTRFTCPAVTARGEGNSTGLSNGETQGGLQREDAEFLLSEAERADSIVRQLSAAQDIILKLLEQK